MPSESILENIILFHHVLQFSTGTCSDTTVLIQGKVHLQNGLPSYLTCASFTVRCTLPFSHTVSTKRVERVLITDTTCSNTFVEHYWYYCAGRTVEASSFRPNKSSPGRDVRRIVTTSGTSRNRKHYKEYSTVTGQTLDNFPSKLCPDMSSDMILAMLNMILWTAQHNCATRTSR